jgi:hypothetical protein
MKVIRAISAAPLLLLATASPAAAEAWTVLGLAMGQPVSMPTCPKKILPNGRPSEFVYDDDPAEVCHEPDIQLKDAPWRRGAINFPLRQMPVFMHVNTAFTWIIDGRVEGLRIETLDHTNTDAILSELKTKFGPPTNITKTTGGPRGVALPAIHAEWRLQGLYVSYRNIEMSVEYGALEIATPKMQAVRSEHGASQARQRSAL